MNTPRSQRFRTLAAALLLTLSAAVFVPRAAAQQEPPVIVSPKLPTGDPRQPQPRETPDRLPSPEAERGRSLLEQGDAAGAVAVLRPAAERDRADAEAWRLLGVAYSQLGRPQDALKALGVAVAVRLDRLSFGPIPPVDRFVRLTDDQRARMKEQSLRRYAEARESVEAYLAQQPADAPFWRTQLAALNAQSEYVNAAMDAEFADARPDSTAVKLVILSKPTPGYTEEARRNRTEGRIRIRALFGGDGKIEHLLAVRPLPHGLSEKAFEAARDIRFTPATVDGRPVSQFITLEYGFALDVRGPGPMLGPRGRPRVP